MVLLTLLSIIILKTMHVIILKSWQCWMINSLGATLRKILWFFTNCNFKRLTLTFSKQHIQGIPKFTTHHKEVHRFLN